MAEDKNAPAAEPAAEEGAKKNGNMVLLIGIIAGIVVIQTALVYLIVPKPANEEAVAQKAYEDSVRREDERKTAMGAVTADAPIEATVNIAGTGGDRYLKAAIILEYDEKNTQLGEELRRRAPRFKDLLLDHLSNLTLSEVTEAGARDKIRKDIQRRINATLPVKLGEVNDVLFTTYIIQ